MISNLELKWSNEPDVAAMQKFEKEADIILPESYKKIMMKYNGGHIVNNFMFNYFNKNLNEMVECSTGLFLPFGCIEDSYETMEIKAKFPPEGLVKGLIIFAALGNGDALCFDYRKGNNQSNTPVVIWHHETEPNTQEEISPVAATFDAFLGMLHEERD